MIRYLFLLGLLLGGHELSARRLTVGLDAQYKTLKGGIVAAQAGDTLLIRSGIYREGNYLINKSIHLLGQGNPILDGDGKYEVLTIKSDHVSITGLTIQHTGWGSLYDFAAIKAFDSKDIKIYKNIINGAYFGIYFSRCNGGWIAENQLVGADVEEYKKGNGIHLWQSSGVTIERNNVQYHRDGIYFEFVHQTKIAHNYSRQNVRYGLHFMFSHDNEYRFNTFENNGAGVAVMYSKRVTMERNRFVANRGGSAYGLLLKDINDSRLLYNRFEDNTTGIFAEGSNRLYIAFNRFNRNGWAIKMMANCMDDSLFFNTFSLNTFDLATNGTTMMNVIRNNYWDKYTGYDLNRDGKGDIPHYPISLFALTIEQIPYAILFHRSLMVKLLDLIERAMPSFTPQNMFDPEPLIKPVI